MPFKFLVVNHGNYCSYTVSLIGNIKTGPGVAFLLSGVIVALEDFRNGGSLVAIKTLGSVKRSIPFALLALEWIYERGEEK